MHVNILLLDFDLFVLNTKYQKNPTLKFAIRLRVQNDWAPLYMRYALIKKFNVWLCMKERLTILCRT